MVSLRPHPVPLVVSLSNHERMNTPADRPLTPFDKLKVSGTKDRTPSRSW